MQALDTFLALLARTEGRDKVSIVIFSSSGSFSMPVFILLNTKKRGPPTMYMGK